MAMHTLFPSKISIRKCISDLESDITLNKTAHLIISQPGKSPEFIQYYLKNAIDNCIFSSVHEILQLIAIQERLLKTLTKINGHENISSDDYQFLKKHMDCTHILDVMEYKHIYFSEEKSRVAVLVR